MVLLLALTNGLTSAVLGGQRSADDALRVLRHQLDRVVGPRSAAPGGARMGPRHAHRAGTGRERVGGVAVVHDTTMEPGKLELLAQWLPAQPWWAGGDLAPQLVRAGGFRLDDPDGEVGIEFIVVTDGSGAEPITYCVPVGYRGAPLAGGELIGTSEHGVLGRRWVYDGASDPVVLAALREFAAGRTLAQDQDRSDTVDPSVLVVGHTGEDVRLVRVLGGEPAPSGPAPGGSVQAGWLLPDGTAVRGPVALIG